DDNDVTATEPENGAVGPQRRTRARRAIARRSTALVAGGRAATAKKPGMKRKPLRNLATIAVVGGLVATVAIPAYGAYQYEAETKTVQQLAEEGAQSVVVASEVKTAELDRKSTRL